MSEWRDGTAGAFVMGLRHGAYCVGCCWVLMALLFVAGVMNLLWVAVIALFVMGEKILARGELLGHVVGTALVTAGVALMARADPFAWGARERGVRRDLKIHCSKG